MDSEQDRPDDSFKQGIKLPAAVIKNPPEMVPDFSIPVGLFYVDSVDNIVHINAFLAELMGLHPAEAGDLPYQNFVQKLVLSTDNPALAQADFERNILQISEHPSFNFTLKEYPGRLYKLFLYDVPSKSKKGSIGGLLVDLTSDQQILKRQMMVLADLSQQSRKISAAAGGNLQALTGNFQSWNDNLVGDFLLDTRNQISSLNDNLDLILNYINILYDRALFPETVNLWELLRDIVQDLPDFNLYFQDSRSAETPIILVHLDPTLTKLALEYLMDEISKHVVADQTVDLVITRENENARINLQSSRTLPLPGFSSADNEKPQIPVNPALLLASNIITSQGGDVLVKRHSAGQKPALSVDIILPLFNNLITN